MPYNLTVSPDFAPEHISGWFIFNTWLQKRLALSSHLELYNDFTSQREAIIADKVDLIYANPFDATTLAREKGFVPIVKPLGIADEAVIAVRDDDQAQAVDDLQPGITVASTDDPNVQLIGMMMLEPADLGPDGSQQLVCDSYVLVAKQLLGGQADAGIFLAQAYDELSAMVRRGLRPLVRSSIQVIHHILMAGPGLADQREALVAALAGMDADARGKGVLESLGFTGWAAVEDEEMEFMIDLMDTLAKQS